MKKLLRYLRNKIKESIHRSNIKRQVLKTRKLRSERRTDDKRWKESSNLYKDWDERTEILANMVIPGAKIIEFGAGNQSMKNYIPQSSCYTPSDIIQRAPEFLVCDLNKRINIDLSRFDTAVFSGVLEYVYDLEKIFRQFPANIKTVLLSYSCSDICNVDRLENGWLSDYSQKELEEIFHKYEFSIYESKEWRNQSIYWLER